MSAQSATRNTDEFMTPAACDRIHATLELRREEQHKAIMNVIGEIKSGQILLNDRLYKDNGHVSIQTRLDRHERFVRVMTWLVAALTSAVILGLVSLLFGDVFTF
jgi:hypothetical protein